VPYARRIAAWLLALALTACGGAPATNLVIVSIDTLRSDVLQAYGEPRPTSPAILAFAGQGLVVETAVSPSPWTLPAHASLLTGLYPTRHGVNSLVLGLPVEAQTLAERLAAAGWRTAAIVNSKYLSSRYGWERGFAELEYIPETPGEAAPTAVHPRAIEWLEQSASEPFFLFLHYYDVHSDYRSLPRYERELIRPYRGRANGSTRQLLLHERGKIALGPRDAPHLLDRYAAGVRQMDDGVAALLAALEARGLAERTLVILTSDHGEELLEHGGVLHGRTLYDEVLRVPLVLRGPGVPAGRRLPGPASLVDVVPTVLSLLGQPVPEGLDGVDLSRHFDGGIPEDRSVFSEADRKIERHDSLRAVRRGPWKLVLDRFTGEIALYDLAADPGERVNVSAEHPERVRELRAEIDAFMARPPVGEAPKLVELDADELKALQALGYL
jgi:arylsulfatase A-like enzyme